MGIPVLGEQAAFISQHPVWGPNEATRDNRFAICAWLTFALGGWVARKTRVREENRWVGGEGWGGRGPRQLWRVGFDEWKGGW